MYVLSEFIFEFISIKCFASDYSFKWEAVFHLCDLVEYGF